MKPGFDSMTSSSYSMTSFISTAIVIVVIMIISMIHHSLTHEDGSFFNADESIRMLTNTFNSHEGLITLGMIIVVTLLIIHFCFLVKFR